MTREQVQLYQHLHNEVARNLKIMKLSETEEGRVKIVKGMRAEQEIRRERLLKMIAEKEFP